MPESLADHLKKRPEFRETSRRARLTYLYSDLAQARINNPTSFTSAASWWSNLLEEIVSKGLQDGGAEAAETSDKLIWHVDQEFCDRLRWEGAGRPTGLGTVAVSDGSFRSVVVSSLLITITDANVAEFARNNRPSQSIPNISQSHQSLLLVSLVSL
jgi:hypothetical protein